MKSKPYITIYQKADTREYYYKGNNITPIVDKLTKVIDNYSIEKILNNPDSIFVPYQVGKTAYRVWDKCEGENCPFNGGWGTWRCKNESHKNYCEPFVEEIEFDYDDIRDFGKSVFATLEKANKKLKSLNRK